MDISLPLIIALAFTACVWAVVLALRLPMLYACLGTLIAICCFGGSFAHWEVGSFTVTVDRIVLALLIGLSVLKRLLTPQPRLQFDRVDLLLAGLLLLLLVSVLTHAAPPRIGTTPPPSYLFVMSYLVPALVYWIARYRSTSSRESSRVFGFFVLFGIYLALTAVCEAHKLTAFVFPRHILKDRILYAGRAVGPFLSAPALGTWLTVVTVSVVLVWSRAEGVAKVLLTPLFPLFAYAEYLTQTRSSWVGFLVAVPLAVLLSGTRQRKQIVAGATLVLAILAGMFLGEKLLLPERAEGRGVVAQSTGQRLGLIQRSLALFAQRPLTGWGFGQFEYASLTSGGGGPIHLVSENPGAGLASHNVLFRFLAETGVLGTVLFVLIFWTWFTHARRSLSSDAPDSPQRLMAILFLGSFIAYWAEAMFHDVTFIMQDSVLLFFLAGCFRASQATGQTSVHPALAHPIGPDPMVLRKPLPALASVR